jgi:hypothetical protein
MMYKAPTRRPSVKTILNDPDMSWPLNGIMTKSNNILQNTSGCESKDRSQQNKHNQEICNQTIQEQNSDFIRPYKSWKMALKEAEMNVVQHIDASDRKSFSLFSECENEVDIITERKTNDADRNGGRGNHGEGINTLVRRLELMNQHFSEFGKQ